MGKSTKSGPRYASGRLKGPTTRKGRRQAVAWDYGNIIVQKRRALFDAMNIKGGKAVDQVFDGIGQLWALDFLDGHQLDPDVLRDTARRYAHLYWNRNGATAPKIGKAERVGFSLPSLEDTGADLMFERWIEWLPAYERSVLEHVTVDYWYSDGAAPFVNRLVTTELLKRGKYPELIEVATAHDRDMLAALLRGLLVLVDGVIPARRAA